MNSKLKDRKIALGVILTVFLLSSASAATQINKPIDYTDFEEKTSNPSDAYDNSNYDQGTSSVTLEPVSDPAITFFDWQPTVNEYTALQLEVTVSSSGFSDDTWSLYYDSSNDDTCDSSDTELKPSDSQNIGITNFTASLPADQDLTDLQVCLTGSENSGSDTDRQVRIYDIRTVGEYDLQQQKVEDVESFDFSGGQIDGSVQDLRSADSQFVSWNDLNYSTSPNENLFTFNTSTDIPPESIDQVSFQWNLGRTVTNFVNSLTSNGAGTMSFSNGEPSATWFVEDGQTANMLEGDTAALFGPTYELGEKGLNFALPESVSDVTYNRLDYKIRIRSQGGDTEQLGINFRDFTNGGDVQCGTIASSTYQNITCSFTDPTTVSNLISGNRVYNVFTESNGDGTQTTWNVDYAALEVSYTTPSTNRNYTYTLGLNNRTSNSLDQVGTFNPSSQQNFFSANVSGYEAALTENREMEGYLSFYESGHVQPEYSLHSFSIDRAQTSISFIQDKVAGYNAQVKDETGQEISGVEFTVFDNGRVLERFTSTGQGFNDTLARNRNYTVRQSIPSGSSDYNVTFYNLNMTGSLAPATRLAEIQEPQYIENISKVYAVQDKEMEFEKAQIKVPRQDTPEVILHCTDWDFRNSDCGNWESGEIDEYSSFKTSDHFVYNVTGFDAFAVANATPVPNVTSLEVYDVTGLSSGEKETEGEFLDGGLNETLNFNQSETRQYRFEFRIENDGRKDWNIQDEDTLYHEGLNSSWPVDKIWYNLSTGDFDGGQVMDRRVSWDTSQGGMLENDNDNDTMYAKYLVNINDQESKSYSQEFRVNDTSENAGSFDYHRIDLKKFGDINLSILQPVNGTTLPQNVTFLMNASVNCINGYCGEVNVTPRYNASGGPDTLIPENSGQPFHIDGTRTRNCEALDNNAQCYINWNINSTGELKTSRLLDVNGTSNLTEVGRNDSANVEVTINDVLLLSLEWETLDFGVLDPGEEDKPALGNDDRDYNLSVEGLDADNLWIRGSDMLADGWRNPSTNEQYRIDANNLSFGLENDISRAEELTNTYRLMEQGISAGTVLSTFYWIDVPQGIKSTEYAGKLYFKANATT
ncbi:MAG: hypothetical protein ACI9LV_000552 [Candidatus Nanohaloarchaea archaeon]